ncbi:MAG TPA: response regulator [Cyclobacteriaceae bacterium]|nr:response regulator [Cyclobacteriaceae bacterium]
MEKKKLRVVLADDDPDDRELFGAALAEVDASTELVAVEDGESLFKKLETTAPPDIIFLDLNMPRKNGRECLAELHANNAYDNVAVIIYSTSMSPQEIADAWTLGAACLIRKPDSYTALKDVIRKVLKVDLSDMTALKRSRLTFNLS